MDMPFLVYLRVWSGYTRPCNNESYTGPAHMPSKEQQDSSEKQGRLIDAEAQLALTVQNMPLGYIVWDRDLFVLEWNRAAERIFGWSAAEITGKHASILLPSLAQDAAPDPLQTALLPKGESGTTVLKCTARDGSTLVCEWHTSVLRDAPGAVQGYLTMVKDFTAREQAERELRQSRTFLQTIIDTEPECVKLIAEDGSLLLMNRARHDPGRIAGAGPGRRRRIARGSRG